MATTVRILDKQADNGSGGTCERVILMYSADAKECLRIQPTRYVTATPEDAETIARKVAIPDPAAEKLGIDGSPVGVPSSTSSQPPTPNERGVRGGPRQTTPT